MKEELLWSLLGGVIATVFNVIYNYLKETQNRRYTIAAEICGEMDFYYQRLVTAVTHLESVFEDESEALSPEEWKQIRTDSFPLFLDEQRIRAKVDIVYGVDSKESQLLQQVFSLLKSKLSTALAVRDKDQWGGAKEALREGVNRLAQLRPEYRQRLVNNARVWNIFKSPIR